jgi:site-specific recombinase XerD
LISHIAENGIGPGQYLFSGRNVEHLTRSGARSRIDNAVKAAAAKHPSLATKRISPHTFRHSTSMSMLASGIDISTIAIWLGHEGIQTTHRYMVADMKLKEDAIAKVHTDWDNAKKGRYKADPKVIKFLTSL